MTSDPRTLLDRYQPYRRFCETGFWVVNFLIAAVFNSATVLLEVERAHLDFAAWEPIVWETTSNLVLLALVPVVIAFERRVPLYFGTFRRNLPWIFPYDR